MRITNKTMNNNLLRNLQSGLQRMDKYNQQLATGRKVQLPSDDPVAASSIMRLRGSLNETEQYLKNVDAGISWLEATDSVLGEVTTVLHRARELSIYGASDTLEDSSREALAREVEQLYDNVIQLANSTHGGKYLFSGQKTTTRPFVHPGSNDPLVAPDFEGDNAQIAQEIAAGSKLGVSIDGEETFMPIFGALADIYNNLMAGNTSELGEDNLGDLDTALDSLLTSRSEVGAKVNRLELAGERLTDLKLNLSKLHSNVADVDVAETIMHLKSEENVYQTALSVGARIIQPSLVDFLR